MKNIIVTGSSGLVGSAVCAAFDAIGYHVHGFDNNERLRLFGAGGDTRPTKDRLIRTLQHFTHYDVDIREADVIRMLVSDIRPDVVVHAAGQPSHDLAATMPLDDFEINATATLGLLDAVRWHAPRAVFVFMSTNKVYGTNPNNIPRREDKTRWRLDHADYAAGVGELMSVDHCDHSIFGCSKLAADVMVQEYGRRFDMLTCCLRAGCITGRSHAGVELHGFLSYLVRCAMAGRLYTIHGHGGKQVRDNLHADDLAAFIVQFAARPVSGMVYNIGGGYGNSCSILEAIAMTEQITGKKIEREFRSTPRAGDHVVYYTDLSRIRAHYPSWGVTIDLPGIIRDIAGV